MDLTVFIRTYNEEQFIERCLEFVIEQARHYRSEIIVLDCGSTDQTVELARHFSSVQVFTAPRHLFHYARALNFGIEKSTGEFFVSLSAHAIPANSMWLKELLKPLVEDIQIDLAFSRQVGWPDISIPEHKAISRQFPEKSWVNNRELIELKLSENYPAHDATPFSNVSSVIRRSLFSKLTFREIPFSEDRLFALEALHAGSKVAYASKSVVYHSHAPTFAAFKSIAFRSTIARFHIQSAASKLLEVSPPKPGDGYGRSLLRCALFPIYLTVASLFAILMPYRTNRLREVAFLVSSFGTSLGKVAALNSLRKAQPKEPPLADPSTLIQAACTTPQGGLHDR